MNDVTPLEIMADLFRFREKELYKLLTHRME